MSVRIIAFKYDGMVNNKYYRWVSDSQLYDQTGVFPLAMDLSKQNCICSLICLGDNLLTSNVGCIKNI